jgi:hypothetical protein
MRPGTIGGMLALALLAAPVAAVAQVSPTAPPHPSMPWSGITTPSGQLLRYIQIPPQPVTLEYFPPAGAAAPAEAVEPAPPAAGEEPKAADKPADEAAPPASPPPAPTVVRQVVMIPGYTVRETTVGYHYPERWTIEQVGPGTYRWRMLPPQFVPK